MSNLLKDASILLTPTGYDNGRMNAIKPYKDLYGPELVTNGDFATNSDWTVGSSWTISGGSANCDGGTSNLDQASIVTNTKYKVTVTVSNITTGTLAVRLGGSNVDVLSLTENGTYTGYGLSNSDVFRLRSQSGFDGSVDNVSVVEDLSGDFNFERGSAATRVNAQGLVENVQIISSELVSNGNFSQIGTEEVLNGDFSQEGSELIVNGDFSNGGADWNSQLGWTFSNGLANFENLGSSNRNLWQSPLVAGKSYKLTFEIISISSGYIRNVNSSITDDVQFSTVGVHTQYFIADNVNLYLKASSDAVLSIDNVSVKEVGQNWSLGTGWSIGDDKASCDGTNNADIKQVGSTVGKTYKATLSITENNVGRLNVYIGGTFAGQTTNGAIGDFTFYATATDTNLIRLRSNNSFNGSITNISVKEVGQDWDLGTGWSISNLGATCSDLNNNLTQDVGVTAGKSYKVTLDITDYTSGTLAIDIGGSANQTATSLGSKTFYFTTTSTGLLRFYGGAFRGTITNISVKEITDDTDIPRINYSGFSYQDSLGSELVVNGSFDTDSNWSKGPNWTISDGKANSDGSSNGQILQSNVFEANKTYQVTFTATKVSGSGLIARAFYGSYETILSITESGTYTTKFTPNASTNGTLYFISSGLFVGSIDNVSVKEVTGQEVVPDSGCGNWLLEPQSTNLITYSEDFSQWNNYITTPTLNSATSPSGDVNSAKLTSTGVFGSLNLTISKSSSALNYTQSVFIKGVNYSIVNLISYGSSSANRAQVSFDLSDGSVSSAASVNGAYSNPSESIEDYGNGWYRISLSFTSDTSVEVRPHIQFPVQMTSDDYVLLWGAQLEEQSYATSYIPTNGATNTRLQDIANNSGNSTLINSTEGVLYAEIAALANDGLTRRLCLSDGTSSQKVLTTFSATANRIQFEVINSTNQFYKEYVSSDLLDFHKVAIKYKQNDFSVYVNGSKIHSTTSGNAPIGLSKLSFDNGTGSQNFYGKAKALAVYKEALTDANLRCLTYPPAVATTFDLDFDTIAEQFTFTRGSEATFVNEQGLIESTNQLGPELVTNGDFSNGNANWTLDGTNAPIVEDGLLKFSFSNGTYSRARQNIGIVNAKITYTVANSNVSTFIIRDYGGASSQVIPATVGTHTIYRNFTGNGISFQSGGVDSGILEIDNVSVKEVISATNTPRIDYSTGEKAFLLEPQRTNRMPNSEDGSTWTLSNITLSSLSGGLNKKYYQITSLGNTGTFNVVQNNWVNTTAGTYTASVFAKKGTCDEIILTTRANFGFQNNYSAFDLTNGLVIANSSGVVGSIKPYGDGWYRCSITFTNTGGFTDSASLAFGFNFNSSSTDTLFVASPQSEIGSYATSYIPTSGAAATRNQELCNNATPVINSTEGTLYAEISALANDGTIRYLSLSDGTSNNRVTILYYSSSNNIRMIVSSNGTNYVDKNYGVSSVLDFHKIAIKYKENDFALWVDGIEAKTDHSGNTPIGLDNLSFSIGGGNNFFGNTKGLKYYPKALADVQLEDLTTI